ncbi:MAG: hypothetical protein IIB16_07745 [Chloroflexi bacterium]|nr:hypothetical protein [Chloroflexota bacterium]
MDRMTEPVGDRGVRSVALSKIQGVTIASHPFDAMRGEVEPIHSPLAAMVPEDNYYLHFNTLAKLHELTDLAIFEPYQRELMGSESEPSE